jgi:hypothetical protein
MRGSDRLLVLSSVAALTLGGATASIAPATAQATHPAALFKLTISEIDRDGTAVKADAFVESTSAVSYLNGGQSVKVPAGWYVVAAGVWRPADGSTETLVADQVHVTGPTHVTLNAQGAIAVDESIGATGVTQGAQTASVCIGSGIEENELAGFLVESPGTVYVKPMASKVLTTVYQTYWVGSSALYEVAGAFKGGIPAHPVYPGNPATMAAVKVQLRNFENATPLQAVIETYDGCGTTTLSPVPLPSSYTDYRTPGNWNTNLNFAVTSGGTVTRDLYTEADYKASHSYTELFGSAVAGPTGDYPETDESTIIYSPVDQFADPVIKLGFDCEGKATVSLTHSSVTVAKQKLTFCGKSEVFRKSLKKTGWYTLTSVADRWNPHGALPARLLSSQVSLAWRFKFTPVTGHPIDAQAEPVTVTKFVPQGLNDLNAVRGGNPIPIRAYILRGGGEPVTTPRYRLRTPEFQASFDDGATWQTLPATWQGSYWLMSVTGPVDGAYVSLRSIQADAHGDSTTETVIRAFAAVNVDGGV